MAVGARLLRPREFLVRSDGRVRYIVLSTGHQLAAACAVVLLTGWVAFSSVGFLVHGNQLDDKDWQLRQSRIAYLELLAEVGASYDGFTTLSDRFAARKPLLEDLIRPVGDPLGKIGSIEERLRRSEADRARIFTGHQALQAKLRRFGADLRALAGRNQALNDTIEQLEQTLQATAEEKTRVAEGRRQLSVRLQATETALAEAAERNEMLESNLLRLEERLAAADPGDLHSPEIHSPGIQSAAIQSAEVQSAEVQSADADPAASLDREVASLKRQLTSKAGKRTLEERIGGMLAALSGMVGQRKDLEAARAELRDRVRALEARLAALRESQDEIVQGLAERTRSGVEEVEKTVAMTGLDVDSLLSRVGREQSGVGGPYVPVGGEDGPDVLLASVASLDDAVARWEGLHHVLRTLPLTAPIDSYWISSHFGKRKDPITGKRAMHEGVDLSAAPKTPVLATAPGRVVFAGGHGSYGRMVEIDHGLGIRTRYAHLRSVAVKVGDEVNYRDKVGLLGSSGRSTGPHLHYEIIVDGVPYDPMKFLKAGRYVFKG